MNDLKVVSLFDGIACARVALERAGHSVSQYAAYEIDKYAKSISLFNFPDIIHCGNVLDADFSRHTGYDVVIGGSPCTHWSIAKANREVDKSGMGWKLFMCFVNAVRQIQPRFFLLENVASMPHAIKEYISAELGCEPILINSALVSAQSRKRFYWTNIPGIAQPSDKGILLKDILVSGIPYQDKSHCITASYNGAVLWNSLERKQRSMVAEPIALAQKSQTILSTLHKENALSMVKRQKLGLLVAERISDVDGDSVGAALRTREDENGRFKRLEVRKDGKQNALTTVLTDSIVCTPVRLGSIGKGGQGNRIYSVHGKTISMCANGGGWGAKTGLYKIDLPDGDYTIRKLFPIEAERCQTLDDDYTAFGINEKGETVKVSNTQRYRSIGNGFTADVIAHILSHMK